MTARPINYATSVRSTNAGPRSSVELPTTPRGLTDSMKQLDITGTTIITTTTVVRIFSWLFLKAFTYAPRSPG